MSDIKKLHTEAMKCLEKYPMAMMVAAVPIEEIAKKMKEHQKELVALDSYDKAYVKASEVATAMIGFPIDLTLIVTKEADRTELYRLFSEWRKQL